MKVAKVGFKSKSRVQKVRRQVDEVRLQEKHPARVALRLALAHKIQRVPISPHRDREDRFIVITGIAHRDHRDRPS